jgi:anti-sigma B factor antagonist
MPRVTLKRQKPTAENGVFTSASHQGNAFRALPKRHVKDTAMDITIESIKDVSVVRLAGRFDAYTAPTVKDKLLELQAAGRVRIVVDLSAVDFVDSTGLATLVAGLKHCRRAAGDMMLVGLRPSVQVIFELTRLDRVFQIHESETAALSGFQEVNDAV